MSRLSDFAMALECCSPDTAAACRGPVIHQDWRDRFAGHAGVVIGNGPSRLDWGDLSELHGYGGVKTYGCNAIVDEFAPTVLSVIDSKMCRELWEWEADRYFPIFTAQGYRHRVHVLKSQLTRGCGSSAGILAAHLAVAMGCHPLILMGFDESRANVYRGRRNYAGGKPPKEPDRQRQLHFRAWKTFFPECSRRQVRVYQVGKATLSCRQLSWVQVRQLLEHFRQAPRDRRGIDRWLARCFA